MKKFISIIAICILGDMAYAQEQLTFPMAVAYYNTCNGGNLDGKWLTDIGEKYFGQEYSNALHSNDEFKINRINKAIFDKYETAKKSVMNGPIYYATEIIDNYSYNFNDSSVEIAFTSTNKYDRLDLYEEGVTYKCNMSNLHCTSNPTFSISNADIIPRLFEMPENIAEKSFEQRKGNNRPAYKLRYYFKFLQCGYGLSNYATNKCVIEVVKVELIDDIVNYKKAYDVVHSENPIVEQTNETTPNGNNVTKQDRYKGDYKLGKRDGKGALFYADGNKYIGEWKDDKKDGKGKMYYANHNEYDGYWQDDKRNGIGTQKTYDPATGEFATTYIGEWKDDKAEGNGEINYVLRKNQIISKFTGTFKNFVAYNGILYIEYEDGTKYKSEAKDGVFGKTEQIK